MKQTTGIFRKTGDRGTSDLFSGERISKASLRLEALGDLDELGCVLGLARFHSKDRNIKKRILELQNILFLIGSDIATTQPSFKIDQHKMDWIDSQIVLIEKKVVLPKGFIVSGKNLSSSYLHLSRAIARRCERRVVALYERKDIKNNFILSFLNRLSVYLYLLVLLTDKKPTLTQ
jgi:cob(I)alamin adenosyltransferase